MPNSALLPLKGKELIVVGMVEQFLEFVSSGSIVALILAYLGLFGLVNQFVKSIVADEDDRVLFHGFLETRKWWDLYAFAISRVIFSLNNFFGKETISRKAFNRSLGVAIAYPWFLIAFSIWLDPARPLSVPQKNFMLAGAMLIFPISLFLYRKFAIDRSSLKSLVAGLLGFGASLLFLLTVLLVGVDDFAAVKRCAAASTQDIQLVQHATNSHFNCLGELPAHDFFFITAVPAIVVSLNSILISKYGLSSFVGGIFGLILTCQVAFPEIVLPVFMGIFLISYGIPLLNGVLDFLSMLVTRNLLNSLEADAKEQSWLRAFKHLLIDMLAALGVLSALSLSFWTVLNLNGQFPDVAAEWLGHSMAPWSPAAFPWSMMFLTILVPTGIHLTFAVIAVSFVPIPMNPAGLLKGKRVSYLERLAVTVWFFVNVVIVTLVIWVFSRTIIEFFGAGKSSIFWRFVYDLPSFF